MNKTKTYFFALAAAAGISIYSPQECDAQVYEKDHRTGKITYMIDIIQAKADYAKTLVNPNYVSNLDSKRQSGLMIYMDFMELEKISGPEFFYRDEKCYNLTPGIELLLKEEPLTILENLSLIEARRLKNNENYVKKSEDYIKDKRQRFNWISEELKTFKDPLDALEGGLPLTIKEIMKGSRGSAIGKFDLTDMYSKVSLREAERNAQEALKRAREAELALRRVEETARKSKER